MAAPSGKLAFSFNQNSNIAAHVSKFGEEDDDADISDAFINSANGQSNKLKFNESDSYDFSSNPFHAGVIGDSFSAKRIRKHTQRKSVDYTSTVVRYVQARMWQRDSRDRALLQSTPAAGIDMLPSIAYSDNPSTSIASKFVHMSMNKNRCSINRVLWTPTGRRLITGSQSGEFTLWNGQSFNFEMILQAHDQAVRSMVWSHNENWMVTGDDGGSIKYWQNNLNNVKANKSAHKESVRDLSFCKTDLKFCSCSDDTTVKVWDFARCQEERSLTGHGWDVKCVDWHPTKSLLVSGGKDSLVKLWDAKSGRELCSFHGHKNVVLCVKWNQNGNWILTSSKDQIIKLYDIRAMKELESFRGHQKDVTAMAWHPFHEEYFVSGCLDGSIFHWLVGHEDPRIEITGAHESAVWDLAWHPIGYLLCSGSYDYTTKFWSRNRPGDPTFEKFNMNQTSGVFGEQHMGFPGRMPGIFPLPEAAPPVIPGTFSIGPVRNEGTILGVGISHPIPPPMDPSSVLGRDQYNHHMPRVAPPLPPGPHPSLLLPPNHHHQQQQHFQQFSPVPLPPHNFPPLQPPPVAHISLINHPHLSHPPLLPLPPPTAVSTSLPPPGPGPSSIQMPVPVPPPLGSLNNMNPLLPPGRFMSMNPLLSGSMNPGGFQQGGMPPLPAPQPNPNPAQMFQQRQMPLLPNPFQGISPPLPPGPPPRGAMKGGD